MKYAQSFVLCLALSFVIAASSNLMAQIQIGAAFTYQGQLFDGTDPATGSYDLEFRLFGLESGGSQLGTTEVLSNVDVTDGRFTVELDFGADAFNGDARWLQIEVENTILVPRQAITATPYSTATRGIYVDANERLGVGTTSPIANMHVRGDGIGTVMRLTNGGVNGSNTALIAGDVTGSGRAASFYGITSADLISVHNDGSGRAARFIGDVSMNGDVDMGNVDVSGELTVGVNDLFVGNDGYVGIGRQTPIEANNSSFFDVQTPAGSNQFGGMHVATGSEGGIPYYGYAAGGTSDVFTYYNGGTGDWALRAGNTTPLIVKTGTGRIGLSTFNPGFLLHCNGSAGKPGGGSWSVASDRRLKKNIADLDGSLDKLMKLRGVTYEYKDPKSINELEGQQIGVVAQEVEKVFPGWVENRDDGYKAVAFHGFEALTVEALRELRAEKDQQIEVLEDENDQLRERLESLEEAVQSMLQQQ